MAGRSLQVRVLLGAVNNLTQPLSAAQRSSAALAQQLQATRNNIKNLSNQATSFDRLTNSSRKTGDQIAAMRLKTQQMATALQLTANPSQKQIAALQRQRAALAQLERQQTTEIQQLNQLRAALYRQGVSISQNSTATQAITARTAQYNRQLQQQEQRLKRVAQARAQYDRGMALRGNLQSGGMSAMMAGAAMMLPIGKTIKEYSQLEDAMKGVAKQVDGLRDDNGQRTDKYYEMQAAIKAASESAQNAALEGGAVSYAELMTGGARMGVIDKNSSFEQQKQDLLAFARVAAKASKAFELPATELAESLGKISGLYKIPMSELESLGDTLNYLDDNTQSKGADIIDVLQRLGGLADRLDYRQAAALGSTFLSLGAQSEVAASAANAMVRELSIATAQGKRFTTGIDALNLDAAALEKSMAVDAMGTIREVLNAVKKLPEVDRLRVLTQLFGKDFGKHAAKLANNTEVLDRQLALAYSADAKGSMQRESDIDRDSLSSQWNQLKTTGRNTFSSLGETLREPLLAVIQTLAKVAAGIRTWVENNPKLAGTIMKVVASAAVLATVLGGLAIAAGMVLGPFLALRLGFSLLTGGAGIGGLLAKIPSLTGFGNIIKWIATSPLKLLGAVGGGVLSGLKIAIGLLASPIGLIAAAFAAAAFLIYKYWEPIKAFFDGFATGFMSGIQPLIDAFAPLAPIFDAIGDGLSYIGRAIGEAWDWFVQFLSPVESSKESLEAATSAGQSFGEIVGAAISALLSPVQQLAEGLSWVLEKLDLIPGAANKAAGAVSAATNAPKPPASYEWDPKQNKMVKKEWKWGDQNGTSPPPKPPGVPNIYKPPGGSGTKARGKKAGEGGGSGNQKALKTSSDLARERLGEIVFKNSPDYLLPSPYGNSVIQSQAPLSKNRAPVMTNEGDTYHIKIEINGRDAAGLDEHKIASIVQQKLMDIQRQNATRKRSRLTDNE